MNDLAVLFDNSHNCNGSDFKPSPVTSISSSRSAHDGFFMIDMRYNDL